MKRYLAIAAVIIIAGGLAWHQAQRPARVLDAASSAVVASWPTLTPDEVASITINHGGATVRLQRAGKGWTVRDRYGAVAANSDLVTRLLHDLRDMRPQRVVTRNPDYFQRFRVADGGDRLTLKGSGGRVLLDLLVGKPGSDFVSTHVRRADSQAIVLVDRSLGWQVGRAAESWRAPKPAAGMPAGKEKGEKKAAADASAPTAGGKMPGEKRRAVGKGAGEKRAAPAASKR